MTCRSKTGFAVRSLAGLAVLAGLLSVSTQAAPPKPPAPPPAGTIYYRSGTVINAVKAGGTSLTADVLPGYANLTWPVYGDVNPAFRPAGANAIHDRWWIYPATTGAVYDNYDYGNGTVLHNFSHRDLFAVRSDPLDRSKLITVRLTDLYGVVNFEGASACWSNDSNDDVVNSFVAGWAQDIRAAFTENPDGPTTVFKPQQVGCTMRLPITASMIDATFVPISPQSASELELDAMVWPFLRPAYGVDGQGVIAPSGNFRLYSTNADTQLTIADWTNPASGNPLFVLWDGSYGAPNKMTGAQWSPDGLTIAIADDLGNIWTQPASGASAPKRVLSRSVSSNATITYGGPIWSPDNKYLVVGKTKYNGSTVTGAWITRLSLTDGKTQDLVSLGTTSVGFLRWVSDN